MKPKPTPGPWAVDKWGWCAESETWDNQYLIAAAPELLEALKNVISFFPYTHIDPETPEGCAYQQAKIAIAKAEVNDE